MNLQSFIILSVILIALGWFFWRYVFGPRITPVNKQVTSIAKTPTKSVVTWKEKFIVVLMFVLATISILVITYFFGVLFVNGVSSPLFVKSTILLIIAVLTLYIGAGKNIGWFTTVTSGTIKIVVANGKFIKVLPNVRGWWYNSNLHKMEPDPNNEHQPHWLTRQTGLYFVSFLWPIQKVHTFNIIKERLQNDPSKVTEFADKIERDAEPTEVDHLLFRIPRPFVLLDTDMSDASRLNILLTGVFLAIDIERLIFEYEAKFFDLLNTGVSGYSVEVIKNLSYDQIRTTRKNLDVKALNDPANEFCLPEMVGLQADSIIMREFSLSKQDQEFQKAEQEDKLAEVRGKATLRTAGITKQKNITEAEGTSQATILNAQAEGQRYTLLLRALLDQGVLREVAAQIVETQIKAEQMSKLTGTLVEAGANVKPSLILPAGGRHE